MSHIIFPTDGSFAKSSDVLHKPTEIPRQLFYIIRGATDAIEALELYLGLLFEPSFLPSHDTRNNSGFLAFDAHVGDTACQLRAGMLLEITKHLRQPRCCAQIVALRSTLGDLQTIHEKARRLLGELLDLNWKKIRAGALSELEIPKVGFTTNELLTRLGWTGIDETHFAYDQHSALFHGSLVSQRSLDSLGSIRSDVSTGAQFTPIWGSEKLESSEDSLEEQWRLCSWKHTVRFLVYSYVLSKYKQLIVVNGIYRATVKPERAFEAGNSLVQQEFGRQFVRPNKRAIGEEFLSLQRYISDLSCKWLESKARGLWGVHPKLHSLLRLTIRTSMKGVSSTSSFVGYLVLRSLWAENATPMIITTTRFCPSGFHINYFSVTLHTIDSGLDTGLPIRPKIMWQLTRLAGKGLQRLYRCLEPHIIISGTSIDGDTSDYLNRLPSAYAHDDHGCCDNEKHCSDMLSSDQDRVVQAIFAEHRHYAFELPGGEALLGEDIVVRRLMDESIPGLSAAWEASKQETMHLGTGSSMKLYMWQHVALESPARFLAHVGKPDRPWIMSAPATRCF